MPGYQFIHIECYGRVAGKGKAGGHTLDSVAAEAERVVGACPHVTSPRSPVAVHGCSVSEATRTARKWALQARDSRGRKLRADGLCLLAGVISFPKSREADWLRFREASVQWLLKKYGERLLSVVEHDDEAHPHIHFYVVPLEGERFEVVHEGRLAAQDKKRLGMLKGDQNVAYIEAMRNWQCDFSESVAARFGLARLGPRKRRLTRKEWQVEQNMFAALAEADGRLRSEIDAVRSQLSQANNLLDHLLPEEIAASRIREQRGRSELKLSARLLEMRARMGFQLVDIPKMNPTAAGVGATRPGDTASGDECLVKEMHVPRP